ncbi:LysR family transcriptional regulator [Amycolatopsis acidicola]|uniref:LysR family transcriptional regulator n=1 Tax=Amycolatopsis acidicola TaxID=2596893 RepID=A0A5N0UQM2_9PSEU|nr:LysR family transcriptional regulator [Amycolatopsis acidicola]KAA9153596.1 LysR family transcriptional regulator [Amycolatopsis acidicola]
MDVGKLQLPWLASFLAVVDEGSMTAAASSLHLSQPRISAHIAALEGVVGAPLFERRPRGVALTHLGSRFLPRARRVFDELRLAADELDAARDRLEGKLRIGSYPGASAMLIAPLLAQYRFRHPAVETDLVEGDAAQLERAVARKQVDFAVRPVGPPADAGLPAKPLCREKIVAVAPSDSALRVTGDLDFLAGETAIVSGDPQTGWADYRDRLEESGVEPAQVIVATMPTTVTAFVRARLGIGLLGAFAASAAHGDGTMLLELPPPLWQREVHILHGHEPLPPPAQAFTHLLRRRGPELTRGLAVW